MKSRISALAALALLGGSTAYADNLLINASFGEDPSVIAENRNNNPRGLLYNQFGYNRNAPIKGWIAHEPGHANFDIALVSGVVDSQSDGIFKDANGKPVTGYDADQRGAWITGSFGKSSSLTQVSSTKITEGTDYELSFSWAYVGTELGLLTYQIIDDFGKVLAEGTIRQTAQDLTLDAITTLRYTGQAGDTRRSIGVKFTATGGDNVFVVDKVSLTNASERATIPEPSTYGLLIGLTALTVGLTRRRLSENSF